MRHVRSDDENNSEFVPILQVSNKERTSRGREGYQRETSGGNERPDEGSEGVRASALDDGRLVEVSLTIFSTPLQLKSVEKLARLWGGGASQPRQECGSEQLAASSDHDITSELISSAWAAN